MKILLMNQSSPFANYQAQESLDLLLMASTFFNELSVLFIDDGVMQLKADQNTAELKTKNAMLGYKALQLYDIKNVYVEKESLAKRGLTANDLMIEIKLISTKELSSLFKQQDHILSY